MRRLSLLLSFALMLFLCVPEIFCQGFTDVGIAQGLSSSSQGSYYGGGLSFVDFNQDGWDDITVADKEDGLIFYQNNEGTFMPVELITVDDNDKIARGVTWVDIENDGDLDLFYTVNFGSARLFENIGDLELVEITAESGIPDDDIFYSFGASWGDFNNDGFLDLYISNYNSANDDNLTNKLFVNNGDKTFEDISLASGCGNGNKATFGSVWMDYDRDGLLDLFVGNDRESDSNSMYRNMGDSTFLDVSSELGVEIYHFNMSNSITDINNDGLLDIYNSGGCAGNYCLQNEVDTFVNISAVNQTEALGFCWGANWLDFDNDMDEDLFVGAEPCEDFVELYENYFFENNGQGLFFENNSLIENNDDDQVSSCIGDFNNDGKVDVFASNENFSYSSLYDNIDDNENHFLKISLEGTVSNFNGVGSWIELYINSNYQLRYTMCGEDFLSQDSYTEIFGTAFYETIDSLIISWPSGHIDKFMSLDVDQYMHVVEGSSILPLVNGSNLCVGDSVTNWHCEDEYTEYLWSTGDTTSNIVISGPGEYSLQVVNEFGVSSTPIYFSVEYYGELEYLMANQQISCYGLNDGTAFITEINEELIDSISWSSMENSLQISELYSGSYYVSILDTNGCWSTDSVLIVEPPEIMFEVIIQEIDEEENGNAEIIIEGGTPPFEINWSNGESGPQIKNLEADLYWVEIQDFNGCTEFYEFEIALGLNEILTSKIVIYPNPFHDSFILETNLLDSEINIAIFDLTGCKMDFEMDLIGPEKFTIKLDSGETGSYVLKITDRNGKLNFIKVNKI